MKGLSKLFATGLGVGYSPMAPGTFGSLWGVFFFYYFHSFSPLHFRMIVLGLSLFAIVVAHVAEKAFHQKDCQKIVIDETAGQLLTYLFVSYTFRNLVLGFVLFRLFDIAKIFPANWAQNHLPGGLGIVVDDLVAGVQAGLVLWLMHRLNVV